MAEDEEDNEGDEGQGGEEEEADYSSRIEINREDQRERSESSSRQPCHAPEELQPDQLAVLGVDLDDGSRDDIVGDFRERKEAEAREAAAKGERESVHPSSPWEAEGETEEDEEDTEEYERAQGLHLLERIEHSYSYNSTYKIPHDEDGNGVAAPVVPNSKERRNNGFYAHERHLREEFEGHAGSKGVKILERLRAEMRERNPLDQVLPWALLQIQPDPYSRKKAEGGGDVPRGSESVADDSGEVAGDVVVLISDMLSYFIVCLHILLVPLHTLVDSNWRWCYLNLLRAVGGAVGAVVLKEGHEDRYCVLLEPSSCSPLLQPPPVHQGGLQTLRPVPQSSAADVSKASHVAQVVHPVLHARMPAHDGDAACRVHKIVHR
mmetsp:Transcript_37516/g.118298  ORF Transcript_37516/g.118298 Transcript_37516/m.118298 type:complete len:379 (+) Transcript_37516:1063-2199(+)